MIPNFYKTDRDGAHYRQYNLVVPLTNKGFATLWDEFRMAEERAKELGDLYQDLENDGIFDRAPGKKLRECLFQEAVQRELTYINAGRKLLLAFGHLDDFANREEPADFVYPTTKSFTVRCGKNPLRVEA